MPPGPCQRHPHPVGDPAGGRERLGTPGTLLARVQRCHPGVPVALPWAGGALPVWGWAGQVPPAGDTAVPRPAVTLRGVGPTGPPCPVPPHTRSPSSTARAAPRPGHGSPQPCVPVACVPQRGPPNPSSSPKAVGAPPPENGARGGHRHRGWGWQDQEWNQNWDQHKAQDLPVPIPPFPLPLAPPGFGSAGPHRPCKKARGAFKRGLLSASVCLHLPPLAAAPLHSHGAGILPLAPFPLGRGTPGAPPGPPEPGPDRLGPVQPHRSRVRSTAGGASAARGLFSDRATAPP